MALGWPPRAVVTLRFHPSDCLPTSNTQHPILPSLPQQAMASSRVTQIKGHLNSTPESVKDDHSTRTREYLESRIGRPKLEDKVCVITGGGTPAGIGRAGEIHTYTLYGWD